LVVTVSDQIFLEGLYTVEQAAWMARVTPRLLRSWLDGEGPRDAAVLRRLPKNSADVISFVDFVQTMAIRAIRTRETNRLSLQKIRATINEAKKLGIDYPFARRHQTYLFQDDVVIRMSSDPDVIIQVTGKYKQHQLIQQAVELYMEDLGFDLETGLANKYTPMRDNGRMIVVDPKIQYGAPVVLPCGYTAAALIDASHSEGSINAAAEAMEVESADVLFALRYNDLLAGVVGGTKSVAA
jgi:uncharacterized protein (DUF433 family)